MSDSTPDNPFPAQAVATFGVRADRIAPLNYMTEARAHLVDYLANYPNSGGGLAVSGGHGSGKTFLLNWLSEEAAKIKHSPAQTMYAKADNQSLPDVYQQLLRNTTRTELIKITRMAVRKIGQRLAGAAQA